MKLQTKVDIPRPESKITHQSKLVMIGSCFAENMGILLQKYKFETLINPCGIAYNPLSVAHSIALSLGSKELQDDDFVFHNEKWHSLHHHGRFSSKDKVQMRENIAKELHKAKQQIESATHLFITLGTAWVFEEVNNRKVVNNCHKLPAHRFQRYRLSIYEIVLALENIHQMVKSANPNASIIFTVSPIRHLKDGANENQLSKASLLLAVDMLRKEKGGVNYFPAYELVMDEMRDYRFYAEDMTHLNNIGVHYIWKSFSENYIAEESLQHFPTLASICKAMEHKIEDKDSEAYIVFRKKIIDKINLVQKQLPHIDFSKEINKLYPKKVCKF